jgi:hypothetical protein
MTEELQMKKRNVWVLSLLVATAFSSAGCLIVASEDGSNGGANTGGNGGKGGDGAGGAGAAGGTGGGTGGTGTTDTTAPSSCDADPSDDECAACAKSSCCAEIEACAGDAECADTYAAYSECLFPAADVEPSGYSTGYCKAVVAADKNPAGALIDCYKGKCGGDTQCGTEEPITWEGFAAHFIEEHCDGCHFAGFETSGLGPLDANGNPKKTADFTCDDQWASGWGSQSPTAEHPKGAFGNTGWFEAMSYTNVKGSAALILCGVDNQLPDGCDATKFPKAQRFPPLGSDETPDCFWMDDAKTCAQPSAQERAKLASWLFDGMACNEGCDVTCPSP